MTSRPRLRLASLAPPLLSAALGLAAIAGAARADDPLLQSLMGQREKAFLEPEGYYAAILPAGFDCDVRRRHVECRGNRGHQALLVITVSDVPASATADLVLLNEMDRFKKRPHFKLSQKSRVVVDGTPAMTATFQYDYLGNVEYQVGVQALYLVRSGKKYVLHFESPLANFAAYAGDLAKLYASFKPAALDAAGHPIFEDVPPPPPAGSDLPDISAAENGAY